MTWQESVAEAIKRLTTRRKSHVFTREELISSEMEQIVREVDSAGATPEQTLSRVLQELRNQEFIAFESPGVYRLLPPDTEGKDQRTLQQIPVLDISPNPHNPRLIFDQEELEELKGSIKKVGILVPLTVYRNVKSFPDTPYVLLDGERRWRCAKELELPTIPANVIDEPKDVTQNILFMFNIHHYRRDWELFPTALKLEKLMESMETDQESVLSNFTGVSRSMIRRCKRLLWFPHKYRNILMERRGKISTDFFIEVYPIAQRLSYEEEYSFPEGVIRLTDALIEKFLAGNVVVDVKEFREVKRAMVFYDESDNFGEFKKKMEDFLNRGAGLNIFTIALEDERNLSALMRHVGYVVSILENTNPATLTDVLVIEQLNLLSGKLSKVLDELD